MASSKHTVTQIVAAKKFFLHISALQGSVRRPKVGDTILYETVAESNGKIRAARAPIQGVASQTVSRSVPRSASRSLHQALSMNRQKRQRRQSSGSGIETVIVIVIVSAIAPFKTQFNPSQISPLTTAITQQDCTIKGNISMNSGNKLYHLHGLEDCETTVTDSATPCSSPFTLFSKPLINS